MKTIHGPQGSMTPDDQRAFQGVLDEFRDERNRAATEVGYTPEHDDAHQPAFMLGLALSYERNAANDLATWPSDQNLSEARDNLVKAGALLASAITRLDREVSRG